MALKPWVTLRRLEKLHCSAIFGTSMTCFIFLTTTTGHFGVVRCAWKLAIWLPVFIVSCDISDCSQGRQTHLFMIPFLCCVQKKNADVAFPGNACTDMIHRTYSCGQYELQLPLWPFLRLQSPQLSVVSQPVVGYKEWDLSFAFHRTVWTKASSETWGYIKKDRGLLLLTLVCDTITLVHVNNQWNFRLKKV